MTEYCDELVLNMKESLVVQPAALEMATIRKKQGDELGMNIQSSYYGCHIIGLIKDTSPAHLCSKIEKGDEVLQVNNQTVLGWQLAKLVAALKEKPKEVTMLLKKRPRHTTPYGNYPNRKQIANRHVPSVATLPKMMKKRRSKDGEKAQRPTLEEYVSSSIPVEDIYITKESPEDIIDGNDTDNDVFRSGSESPQFTLPVIVDAKQRRATVSGGSPTFERPSLVVEDLDPAPIRPKSQAIIPVESAPTLSFSTENSLFKKVVKHNSEKSREKEKKQRLVELDGSCLTKVGHTLHVLENVLNLDTDDLDVESVNSITDTKIENLPVHQDNLINQNNSQNLLNSEGVHQKLEALTEITSAQEDIQDTHTQEEELEIPTQGEEQSTLIQGEELSTHIQGEELSTHAQGEEQSTNTQGEEQEIRLLEESQETNPQEEILKSQTQEKVQEFTVNKPTPVLRDSAAWNRQQKIISTEIAGNAQRGDLPQLVRIKRLDSTQINELESNMAEVEVSDKPTKHVGFVDDHAYRNVVIGGVIHKIPVDKPITSSPPVKLRTKPPPSKRKLDRRVSCKDLGKGDCEGWLYKRKQKSGTLSKRWDKRWCVLKMNNLFYYKNKDDEKAEGVIHLPAFQVSPANNLKTKKFAFNIHNTGTTFSFASERQDDMSKWMNKLGLASISYKETELPKDEADHTPLPTEQKSAFYSESEDDDDNLSSWQGSLQSLASISSAGSSISPQTSPAHKRHNLQVIKTTVGASTEELHSMLRTIENNDLTIDGKDKIKQRQSQCMPLSNLAVVCPVEVESLRKLHSLQRTLKAKELELQQIESLMNKPNISPAELREFLKLHDTHLA
ncbi:uncharacterized protein LOC131953141 isoform X1 [Physella acuta]|uniref:uncharacterized protein LOC131953141 isoform X1 n=1 Tax=Physella acuta TaxID=109671 RepID=UPI0027DBDDB2|nr:uncharacterized protein LOC131953141 isoform X1 [Physella acuta]